MRKYNYLQAWWLAFYSRDFYRDVGQQWRGIGLLYLLSLLAVCLLLSSVKLQRMVDYFVTQIAPPIAAKLPDMTIEHGKLKTSAEMPYTITEASTGRKLAVIDTTGKVTNLAQSQAAYLLTENSLFYRDATGQAKEFAFAQLPAMQITKANVDQFLQQVKHKAVYYIAGFLFINYLATLMLLVVLFSIFSVICARQLNVNLGYKSLLRLTAIAFTPLILLVLLDSLFPVAVPYQMLIFFFLAIFYIYFAIRANRPEQNLMVNPV